jgi:hypothetical protein
MSMFNDNILKIIDKYSYEAFIVNQDKRVNCVCVNHDTKQPDPNCKKCLGTGHKIKIKKILVSNNNTNVPAANAVVRDSIEVLISQVYYIPARYKAAKDDLIIDGNDVYELYEISTGQSDHGELVYQKAMGVTKKYDQTKFMDNFNEIIGRR